MDQFVCVRLTRAEKLDLSLFQFDPDLSFAVFFLNADKTIYGRYSTRSDFYQAARDVSLEGLKKAMELALQWHKEVEDAAKVFHAKRGPEPMFPTLSDFPSSRRRSGYTRTLEGTSDRCTHCHDIRTAEQMVYRAEGQPMPNNVLFSWPMPDSIGLHLDPKQVATVEKVHEASLADVAGFQVGDEITAVEDQPILSIADVQWVLQNAGDQDELTFNVRRGEDQVSLPLALQAGWRRRVDISWRITTRELRRRVIDGISYRDLSAQARSELGLESDALALQAARGVSRSTGLIRRGDVVIAVDGDQTYMSEGDLIAYYVQKKKPGDEIKLTILRSGKTIDVNVPVK